MATILQGEQFTPTFAKYSTIGGVAGTLRLVSTGEATNILPIAVVLQTAAGVSYTAGGGGGGGAMTLIDGVTATNVLSVEPPGTSGIMAASIQGVPGGVAVPVSGTFYPATQPVSIAASVAVTGAFYQATQPVSIAGSVAVTGTFYQTTQPVSGTVTANAGTGFPSLTAAGTSASGSNLLTVQGASGGVAIPVSGTFYQTTQPVSIAATINNTPQVAAAAVSATNPMPTTSGQFARVDKSGTITAGGTAQTLFAAGAITHGGYFQNLSTVNMWIRDDGTAASAASGSVLIPANGGFWYWDVTGVPTTSVSIFCATTSSAFTCKVW